MKGLVLGACLLLLAASAGGATAQGRGRHGNHGQMRAAQVHARNAARRSGRYYSYRPYYSYPRYYDRDDSYRRRYYYDRYGRRYYDRDDYYRHRYDRYRVPTYYRRGYYTYPRTYYGRRYTYYKRGNSWYVVR